MPITIVLQDESGRTKGTVEDLHNTTLQLLRRAKGMNLCVLSGINPYGDTVYNGLQMDRFLQEWDVITGGAASDEERLLASSVRAFAIECQEGVHLYLKFIGD